MNQIDSKLRKPTNCQGLSFDKGQLGPSQGPTSLALKPPDPEPQEGFEFTLNARQLITHEPSSPTYRKLKTTILTGKTESYGSFRPTPEVFAAWESTLVCARALEARIVVF
jgi:hypothetical protein